MVRAIRSVPLVLLILLLPAAARGQGPQPDSVLARLQAVTVTTTRAAGVSGGASAVVVRPDELRSSPAPQLEEALRETPFVHVRQNSRGEMELSVRGSDSRQAAVLLDGVPITLGWDHRTDPSLVPITGAQRLMVVRGLGSVLKGPNTLGGTIEVTHAGVPQTRMWAGGGFDENSAVVTSLGGAGHVDNVMSGSLHLQSGFAYRKRDGVSLPGETSDPTARDGLRTNSDLRHVDGFGSVHWRAASGAGFGLTLSAYEAERGVPPEEHIAEPRLWRYPYHRRAIAALSARTPNITTPLGSMSLDFGTGYNTGEVKIETYSDRTYASVIGAELGDERTWTGRAALTHSLGQGTFQAAITGADISYLETLNTDPAADYRQKMLSAGAEVELPFGIRSTLSGGVVYDRTSTPETGGRTPGQEPFDDFGWRAGASHLLGDAVRLHASVSQRARFPSLRELYSGALNRFVPNPELKPETLLGMEGGVTFSHLFGEVTHANVQVTGFRHQLNDAVVRVTLPAPDRRFMRINRDRMDSYGLEMLAGLVFGAERDRSVTLNGDLTLQRITIRDRTAGDAARHAENNPETRGSLELGVPLPLQLRATGNARYTGTQYCLNSDTGNEDTLDSQAESDLALERSFTLSNRGLFRSLRALVAIDNIGDATVFDQCGLPQPGRTMRVMFTLR
jgi:iron complex outermembrane receptor protein